MSAARALQLKEDGNRYFQRGDFVSAEGLYSKAIIADPKNPALYTNRAMARLRLGLWDSVISDCKDCLSLAPDNMKAHYYLSQALSAEHDYESALDHARQAHELCVASADKSLSLITAHVLRCKKERWEALERSRRREDTELESETLAMMERERDEVLRGVESGLDRRDIEGEWATKLAGMRRVFDKATREEGKRAVVPDWAIDDITFAIMVDPVITKAGKSYERSSIMEHLARHQTDPLTREPLYPSDLRPNLALKQACEEFLEENGWAVDW